jgi:hypothetical protein
MRGIESRGEEGEQRRGEGEPQAHHIYPRARARRRPGGSHPTPHGIRAASVSRLSPDDTSLTSLLSHVSPVGNSPRVTRTSFSTTLSLQLREVGNPMGRATDTPRARAGADGTGST